MAAFIELRVKFRSGERLLRLREYDDGWYAALLVPGKRDVLTDEHPEPSPPDAVLPRMEIRDFVLRIEAPQGKVDSLGVFRLLASGRARIERGWVVVGLRGITSDYGDAAGERTLPEQARILKFPRQKARDIDMDR